MIAPFLVLLGAYGVYRLVKSKPKTATYTFGKGDVAASVAERFGTTVQAIQATNGGAALRMTAPDGSPTTIDLPRGASDKGARSGANGKANL